MALEGKLSAVKYSYNIMKPLNNGRERTIPDNLLSPMKHTIPELCFFQLSCLQKGSIGNCQTTEVVDKTIVCAL